MSSPGKFITLEGIEGVGKSTQVAFVADWLTRAGRRVTVTREPGGTELGEAVRALLLDNALPPMAAMTELLLVFAARAEHLARVIEPALASGHWVVCDRFTDATWAYQGGGRGLPGDAIGTLETLVQGARRPDLTLLLDAPVTLALGRAKARGAADRFESERAQFFEKVRAAYLAKARLESDRFRIIDAAQTLPTVQAAIVDNLACLQS